MYDVSHNIAKARAAAPRDTQRATLAMLRLTRRLRRSRSMSSTAACARSWSIARSGRAERRCRRCRSPRCNTCIAGLDASVPAASSAHPRRLPVHRPAGDDRRHDGASRVCLALLFRPAARLTFAGCREHAATCSQAPRRGCRRRLGGATAPQSHHGYSAEHAPLRRRSTCHGAGRARSRNNSRNKLEYQVRNRCCALRKPVPSRGEHASVRRRCSMR